jgi:hypothetical protein
MESIVYILYGKNQNTLFLYSKCLGTYSMYLHMKMFNTLQSSTFV